MTREFPAQMASNAENVSIWRRHYELTGLRWQTSRISMKMELKVMAIKKQSNTKYQNCCLIYNNSISKVDRVLSEYWYHRTMIFLKVCVNTDEL